MTHKLLDRIPAWDPNKPNKFTNWTKWTDWDWGTEMYSNCAADRLGLAAAAQLCG